MSKKVNPGELPSQVGKGLGEKLSGAHGVSDNKLGTWATVVKAAQANFDHLMGVLRNLTRAHNSLVDDFKELLEYVQQGLGDTVTTAHAHDGADPDGGAPISHSSLTGVTADQHHPRVHTMADHADGPYDGAQHALNDLTDVVISAPTDGQVLKYVAANARWENGTGGGGGTGSNSFAFFIGG